MFPYPILFWLTGVLAIVWNGWTYISIAVGESYHPNASLGDLLRPLKEAVLFAPIVVLVFVFLLWIWRRPLPDKPYEIGLVLLIVAMILPWFPKIDSGYRQEYWLAQSLHEIPWQYSPFNGSKEPGGKYFLLRVALPDLLPEYETSEPTVIIGKAVDFNHGKGGAAPEKTCIKDGDNVQCEWRRGAFVYLVSGKYQAAPDDLTVFMGEVADLLDGFEVTKAD